MTNESIATEKVLRECAITDQFLDDPNEDSFTELFQVFAPQLVAFFRARGHEPSLAEDLAQEVMLTVFCKAGQIRDRALFRAWLFKIAHNALCRQYGKSTREVETINLADVDYCLAGASHEPTGTHAFEFRDWMAVLDARERDVMILRFVEQWEYHEIAAARKTPIGTIQWRIFNSKKKLASHLASSKMMCARTSGALGSRRRENTLSNPIGPELMAKES
jgi:RNA polymerase sigma factor (sigma-70 family)